MTTWSSHGFRFRNPMRATGHLLKHPTTTIRTRPCHHRATTKDTRPGDIRRIVADELQGILIMHNGHLLWVFFHPYRKAFGGCIMHGLVGVLEETIGMICLTAMMIDGSRGALDFCDTARRDSAPMHVLVIGEWMILECEVQEMFCDLTQARGRPSKASDHI